MGIETASDDAGKKVSRNSNGNGHTSAAEQDVGEWVCVGICEGHAESVGAIAFARRASVPGAPFAPFIVTASQDRTVKLWDLSPLNALLSDPTRPLGAPLHLKSLLTQRVHEKDINCLDIAPTTLCSPQVLKTGPLKSSRSPSHLLSPPTRRLLRG